MKQGECTDKPREDNSGQYWSLHGEINKDCNNQSVYAEVEGEKPYE